ncbi:cytochrome c oxidase subunit II [Anabaena sp. UHCC 0399]|uniref:cytochrome c oxidase subunit II n=1 Tax=Anabaena sp. UHCC 0399 TaxID=3110238 RepID=UPI002B1FB26C|nr:cytochrome c oxidase subunit II [Anabaena sp. UHCC 0399]MEA5566232.1 cytochrome c oxidase subunit II [Anabaena sp. UHCC 0399]
MKKIVNTLLLAVVVAVMIVVSYWVGKQAYSWMPPEATAEAQRVDELFSFLVSVAAFIFLGVVGTIIYSIIFYRSPRGDYSEGHPARSDWKIETLWIVVPTILVLWIAFQSYNIYEQLNIQGLTPIVLHIPAVAPASATTKPSVSNDNMQPVVAEIGVLARQWAWSFRYPNNLTSTELHLPVNQRVRLVLNSKDVLHGFYVPEFRIKQDIIPNRAITFIFTPLRTGKYQLRDSQFSGRDFALMTADVYVESLEAYNQWLTLRGIQNSTFKMDYDK